MCTFLYLTETEEEYLTPEQIVWAIYFKYHFWSFCITFTGLGTYVHTILSSVYLYVYAILKLSDAGTIIQLAFRTEQAAFKSAQNVLAYFCKMRILVVFIVGRREKNKVGKTGEGWKV